MQQENSEEKIPKPTKKRNYIKTFFKTILFVVIGFFVLNLLLYGLLSIPAIQQKVLGFALTKVKEIVKTEVRIDEVRLKLFNHVDLKGVYIEDQSQDTLIYAKSLDVSLSPWQLLKSRLLINAINIEDFKINISQQNPDSDFNFQFLVDAFAGDSTSTDTTSSTLQVDIQDITLKKGNLSYHVLSEPLTPGIFNVSHIYISNLESKLSLPSIDVANLKANLSNLSFTEQSGLIVNNLKGDITSKGVTFYLNNAELNMPHSTLKIPSAEYNMLTSSFAIKSEPSVISPVDLFPVMHDLKHLKNDIEIEISAMGKLPLVKVDNLLLNYGNDANIKADLSVSDYENYDSADLNLNIGTFRISPSAITDFARVADSTFVAPDILVNLGTVNLDGSVTGKLNDLDIKAEAWAKPGALQLQAKAATDTTFENFSVNAKLQTQNFNLGSLLDMPDLGRLSGNVDLVAAQTSQNPLNANAKGTIVNIQYDKTDYRNIPFTAYYNSEKMGGWLNADLPQGKLEAKVDMTQDNNPRIDIDMSVRKLKIDHFYQNPDWKNPELSLDMKGYIRGIDLKNIHSDMVVDNFEFSHDSLSFKPGQISFQAGNNDTVRNYIRLNSSLLKANISGDYDFMSLSDELFSMLNTYLPGLFKRSPARTLNKNNFNFDVTVFNTEELGQVMNLPFSIVDPLLMSGSINTVDRKLKISGDIPYLKFGDMDIKSTKLDLLNDDSNISLTGNSNVKLDAGDIKIGLNSKATSDSINTFLAIKRDSSKMNVDASFNALAHFEFNRQGQLVSSLRFLPSLIDIGKLNLSFMPAVIENEGDRTSISNFGFMVGRGRVLNKYFGVDGIISKERSDTLNVSFFNARIADVLRAFDIENISAIANGDVRLTNILDKPEVYTDNMRLSDIIIFNDTLGTFNVNTQWSEAAGAIKFDASLVKNEIRSIIDGWVYPQRDSLDLNINIDRLSLAWLQPFMAGMLNRVSGSISSNLTARGNISSPSVQGWLGVNDAYIGIDYTNVTYHIADTIQITPDKIGFDNLVLEDPNKNRARINALVTHKGFQDMKYKLDATLNNFMVLNTAGRTDSLFYGQVFTSGTVNIDGSDELIDMKMNLRNGRNSSLNILIPQSSDAGDYQSIVYINTPEDNNVVIPVETEPENTLPLRLRVNLTVTPDLALGVVINPLTGDAMQAKGEGLIDFSYDMRSEAMNAIGNYTLTDGSVKLKLQNIYNIEFKIREGSKLVFNGDPLKTNFDITAFKRVRADLRTLDAAFGSDQYSSPIVYADCVLGIKGNMDKMDLTYDISLPEASDDVQQRLRTILSTDEQKTRQFAYLLVTGSFYSGGSAGNDIAGGVLTSVASSALSSGLNSVLGKAIGSEWQIGTNLQSSDGSFENMDMTVSLSRKFLNNRLEFNTNLGYRTDQVNDGSFIGDFDVAYALTRAWKLKVFNKTNDRYYKQAPTTQGIGIVYTREAKTIKELFRFFRKKRNRNNPQRQIQNTGNLK